MARSPKPWFWARRGVYLVTINGKDGVLQMNRNKGEDDEETAETEEELRRRMLDDEEDEDGMEGGAGPTRPGGRGG